MIGLRFDAVEYLEDKAELVKAMLVERPPGRFSFAKNSAWFFDASAENARPVKDSGAFL